MNDNIKRKLKQRTKLIKSFYKNVQMKCDYDKISEKSTECTAEILEAKKNYILDMTSKLADFHTASKTYWNLLNCLLYNKKIPSIPPLLADGKFVFDFYEKSNIFNKFFASICAPIKNASTLPSFSHRTNTRIKSFNLKEKDILSIIKSLDPTKAHGCDNLSIKMIQICNEVITIPLKLF